MKLLCLSDLHLHPAEVESFVSFGAIPKMMKKAMDVLDKTEPDAVAITGDTVQGSQLSVLPEVLKLLSREGRPIFATLGNHELWGHSLEEAREILADASSRSRALESGVHFLDLEKSINWNERLVTGCVLLFDGSMKVSPDQVITDWFGWQDYRIKNIEQDYQRWCDEMSSSIREEISKNGAGKTVILCTHHLPDERLNGHEPSVYSFFSGVKNLVEELPLDEEREHWMICGHTHKRVILDLKKGVHGVNTGSDYGDLQHALLEV